MDRQQLINAILTRSGSALEMIVKESRPRRTIYFLVGEPGGQEYLQLSEVDHGKRRMHWNLQGRFFDETGAEWHASELKGWQSVDKSLKCCYVKELPFKVDCGDDVRFAFRGEVVNMNHG